jgi:dUTP pyrophosphatase
MSTAISINPQYAITGSNIVTYYAGPRIECLVTPGAKLPQRAHPSDAGADLFAWFGEDLANAYTEIMPQEQKLIDTGIAVKIPYGFAGFVYNRSSQGKKGIQIPHSVGIIDSDYRGTIKVILKNLSNEVYKIEAGDRIAQLVIQKIELCTFSDIWNDTQRGTGGFGSTGT